MNLNNLVFKAWDKINKRMCWVWQIDYWNHGNVSSPRLGIHKVHVIDIYNIDNDYLIDINNVILLPFTGLHDVKGEPVFRHSIIQANGFTKHYRDDNNFYVEWSEKYACYYPINCVFGEIAQPSNYDILHILDGGLMVGDIYHNPDLVKVRK